MDRSASDVRTRRSVIAGAASLAAGIAAGTFARPGVALAGSDGDVVLGAANLAETTTTVNSGGIGVFSGPVLRANATVAAANAGVLGYLGASPAHDPQTPGGVVGIAHAETATVAAGVVGEGDVMPGVKGYSSVSTGVFGVSESGSAPGVFGWSQGHASGVFGYSGDSLNSTTYNSPTGYETNGPADTGVTGYTNIASASATGVRGEATQGAGVRGVSVSGIGVAASSTTGVALAVTGKVTMNRSGRKSIGSGKSSLVVTMAGVTSSSYIVATLQARRTGTWVQAVVPATGSFTIYLSKALSTAAYVCYVVIN